MADHLDAMIDTVESPELQQDDSRPGRVRFFRRCGPERWLRVIVEFSGETDAIVTAFPQTNDPAGWRQ